VAQGDYLRHGIQGRSVRLCTVQPVLLPIQNTTLKVATPPSGSESRAYRFFNIVWKLLLEIEVPYLLAIGKFIGAQMSEIVVDREQRSVESHAWIAPSFYPYFDSGDRFRTFGIAID
jgi:hypothetical protein